MPRSRNVHELQDLLDMKNHEISILRQKIDSININNHATDDWSAVYRGASSWDGDSWFDGTSNEQLPRQPSRASDEIQYRLQSDDSDTPGSECSFSDAETPRTEEICEKRNSIPSRKSAARGTNAVQKTKRRTHIVRCAG